MKQRPAKTGPERLQKVLAEAGVAARRVCEQMIEAGRVTVNGEVVSKLPVFVTTGDDIAVDGRRISKTERHLYLMLNKPERTLVTSADEPGMERRTVMDLVDHPAKARLFPVGRLDFDTTGLVLLTNDGDLAHRLTHPSFGIVKTYHASVKGQVDDGLIEAVRTKLGMARSRDADTGSVPRSPDAQPMQEIVILRREPGRTLLEITISEARNREIREVLKMLGAPVKRLSRMGIGTLTLRGLPVGAWRELTREEIQMVRRSGKGERPDGIRRPSASVPRRPAKKKPVGVKVGEYEDEETGFSEPAAPRSPRAPRPDGAMRSERPDRPARPERRDDRDDRNRDERSAQPSREDRGERPDRSDRPTRAASAPKQDKTSRPARQEGVPSPNPTGSLIRRATRGPRPEQREVPAAGASAGPARSPAPRAASRPSQGSSRGGPPSNPSRRAPADRSASDRPTRDRPTGRSNDRVSGRPEGRPDGRPNGRPNGRPGGRPNGRIDGRSEGRTSERSSGRPTGRSNDRPNGKANGRPGKPRRSDRE